MNYFPERHLEIRREALSAALRAKLRLFSDQGASAYLMPRRASTTTATRGQSVLFSAGKSLNRARSRQGQGIDWGSGTGEPRAARLPGLT